MRWLAMVWLLSASAGCGIVMVGEPVEKMDLSDQDPAQKNLEAIRAMQYQPPSGALPQPMTPPPPPLNQVPIEKKPSTAP